ncbi:MAG: serine/threonine protein kinase [Myxococcales bacterium]|nr:serine/threonine protein kinase [Myxococcales bacterium]
MAEPLELARRCYRCGEELAPGAPACPNGCPVEDIGEDLVGKKLGEYQVKRRVGHGGLGIVYEAVQPVIGKRVAIKVLRHEFATDLQQVRRLLDEARVVNAIGHRSIVDIFGIGQVPSDRRHYIVMEFLEGRSLEELIETEGALSPDFAVELLEEILAGLSAAHTAGVVHRDIKASNVHLVRQADGSRYVKLLDFGMAKQVGTRPLDKRSTQELHVMGTPDYMAPEQAKGEPTTAQSDLYALGVLSFQMLTGQLPFSAPSAVELMTAHVQQPPPRPSTLAPGIPHELEELVLRLMAKDPQERPATAEAVRGELRRISRHLAQAVTQLAVLPRRPREPKEEKAAPPPPPPRKSRAWSLPQLAGAGGLLLLAIATGSYFALRTESSPPPVPPPPVAATPAPPAPVAEASPPQPAEPPVEISPPEVRLLPRAKTAPVPSQAQLAARISQLERKLRRATPKDEEPDPTAALLLRTARQRLQKAKDARERKSLAESLDTWERNYLRKR